MRSRRPGIYQIGRVTQAPDGATVVSGWGLSLCATGCTCHRDPVTGQLAVAEDQQVGLLGLVRHRPCSCCRPWSADELAAVIRDLATAAALDVEPQA